MDDEIVLSGSLGHLDDDRDAGDALSITRQLTLRKQRKHPMWLLPVSTFLGMAGPPRGHQQLLSEGLLVRWTPGMFAIFVSHQWVAFQHPDPKGEQLQVLREALQAMIQRRISVSSDLLSEMILGMSSSMSPETMAKLSGAYLWYDYWSIPQPRLSIVGEEADTMRRMIRSVDTIPSYVRRADVFVALCPELLHEDTRQPCSYRTWSARGWCRLETASRGLSGTTSDTSSIVLVTSGVHVALKSSYEWLGSPVGDGEFTVEADRALLRPVVKAIVNRYLSKIPGRGDVHGLAKYRFIVAMKDHFLHGLPPKKGLAGLEDPCVVVDEATDDEQEQSAQEDEATEVASFLQRFRFRSLLDHGEAGMSPLHCAAVEGRPVVLRAAVAMGAHADARIEADIPDIIMAKGTTPLYIACLYPRVQGVETVRCLLSLKADPKLRNGFGASPLITTAVAASRYCPSFVVDMIDELIKGGASVDEELGFPGGNVLFQTAVGTDPASAKVLISRGSDARNKNCMGSTLLHMFPLMGGGSADLVHLLQENGADINAQVKPLSMGASAMLVGMRVALRLGHSTEMVSTLGQLEGSTPLAMAALMGRSDLCKAFLEAKADHTLRNVWGHSAMDLAVKGRHDHVAELLRSAGCPAAKQQDSSLRPAPPGWQTGNTTS